ncbi:hypothetical protein ASE69_18620 [Sphingomonas sp. Leaf208]|nr:hypothetical protein ASE69_18620 [Sphingomonas sp. Leaf208]
MQQVVAKLVIGTMHPAPMPRLELQCWTELDEPTNGAQLFFTGQIPPIKAALEERSRALRQDASK